MNTEASTRRWLTGESVNQGYPILFRRPNIAVSEYASLAKLYPVLIIGTLQLAKFKDNGLPEAAYNESLAGLDSAITNPFRTGADGIVGLVETFAAKRTFYLYVTTTFDVDHFTKSLSSSFPGEDLTWERKDDPTWKLLNGYASDFRFA